jgi:predicted lipid-binding transport protein (Tim44 family)
VSQLVSATRDRNGKVIEGDAVNVTNVSDVWIFARNVRSQDLNWKIVATEASG